MCSYKYLNYFLTKAKTSLNNRDKMKVCFSKGQVTYLKLKTEARRNCFIINSLITLSMQGYCNFIMYEIPYLFSDSEV